MRKCNLRLFLYMTCRSDPVLWVIGRLLIVRNYFGFNLNHHKEFSSYLLPQFRWNKVYVPIVVVDKRGKTGENFFWYPLITWRFPTFATFITQLNQSHWQLLRKVFLRKYIHNYWELFWGLYLDNRFQEF